MIGASLAVVESVAKIVAMGGNFRNIRLSFQEYFEKLGNNLKNGETFSFTFRCL
jgi:phosphoribosylformylglycinamidine synthase